MRFKVHHIDEELAGPGYRHDLFEFEAGGFLLVARSYLSSPGEAHFLRKEIGGELLPLEMRDVESDSFREAVSHLRALGKIELTYLSPEVGGYVAVAE